MTRGFTWLDWVILVLVLAFAVRGLVRGTLGQIFGLIGLAVGLWTAGFLGHWVGDHWSEARPTAVFWVLRWLVALLGGLAAASVFEWLSLRVRDAVDATPARWLDRLGGFLVGAATGFVFAALVAVAVVLPDWFLPPTNSPGSARAPWPGRLATPTLVGAARACELARGFFPGSEWLERRIDAARHRLEIHTQQS